MIPTIRIPNMLGVIGEINDVRSSLRAKYSVSTSEEAVNTLPQLVGIINIIADQLAYDSTDMKEYRGYLVRLAGVIFYAVEVIDVIFKKSN